mmetsp:Transcript_60875/g.120572  ORF Transcript_60875/g.120572 Transcript_60875/m.120572 type:complete len:231 (+) Transcript_60875:26-718(+)
MESINELAAFSATSVALSRIPAAFPAISAAVSEMDWSTTLAAMAAEVITSSSAAAVREVLVAGHRDLNEDDSCSVRSPSAATGLSGPSAQGGGTRCHCCSTCSANISSPSANSKASRTRSSSCPRSTSCSNAISCVASKSRMGNGATDGQLTVAQGTKTKLTSSDPEDPMDPDLSSPTVSCGSCGSRPGGPSWSRPCAPCGYCGSKLSTVIDHVTTGDNTSLQEFCDCPQ